MISKILSPQTGTSIKNRNIPSKIEVMPIAFSLLFNILSDFILYISLEVIIIECVPLEARRKAEKKNTTILKLILSLVTAFVNSSATDPGKADNKYSSNASIGIENLEAIAPINAISGIIERTKKKASCPGSTLISGFVIIEITFLKNPVTCSIFLHPFYFISSFAVIISNVASLIASSNVLISSVIIL